MPETFSKVEVITRVARRRRFTTERKLSPREYVAPIKPAECPV
jgi:hypothetical protein